MVDRVGTKHIDPAAGSPPSEGDVVNTAGGLSPDSSASKRLLVWGLIVSQILAAVFLLAVGDGVPSVSMDPQTEDETLKQGFAAQALGRTEDAERAYAAVLASNPNHVLANYNLGVIEQKEGDARKAEQHYQAALATDPNFVPALFNLAILRDEAGKLRESESLYRKAVAIDPSMARAHLNLGFLLLRKLDREEEGKAEILKAIELDGSLASRVPVDEVPEVQGR